MDRYEQSFVNSPGGGRRQFVATEFRKGVLRVKPVGPTIGQREAPIITDEVRDALTRHAGTVRFMVIDLSAITMLCSMGLGMCIDLRNQASRQKARSVLFGLKPEIAELFRMMRIERLYTIVRDPAEIDRLAA